MKVICFTKEHHSMRKAIIFFICFLCFNSIKAQNLNPEVKAFGVFGQTELPNVSLVIEEFLDTRLQPILPYIYFEKNSDKIPERYSIIPKEDTKRYEPKELFSFQTLQVYYHILNIIGKRLTDNPGAMLTINGCTDGKEEEGTALSKRRAESVRDYFVNIWGIESSRFNIKASRVPDQLTKSSDALEESDEENRRVEISSNSPQILAPIKLEQFSYKANPPIVRFYLNSKNKQDIQRWELIVTQGNAVLYDPTSTAMPNYKDWKILENSKKRPKLDAPIKYKLTLYDKANKAYTSDEQTFTVEQVTVQKKIVKQMNDTLFDEYSLILFDFGKTDLNSDHKSILEFVKNRINPSAVVKINGYTDHLGDRSANQIVSERRAESVSKYINHSKSEIAGYGEDKTFLTNALPEGRAYSRTVKIIAIIPTKH